MKTTQNPVGDPEGSFWGVNQSCLENIQNLAFVWFEIQKLLSNMDSEKKKFKVL